MRIFRYKHNILANGWSAAFAAQKSAGRRSEPVFFFRSLCMNIRKQIKEESTMNALEQISKSSMKENVPEINVGDTVKVHVRIQESADKYRIQVFEGTVIAKKHGGISETFTVRRVAHGVGIERVFPVHSPAVDKVEIVRRGVVRRAKLYYLRDRVGKAAKVKGLVR